MSEIHSGISLIEQAAGLPITAPAEIADLTFQLCNMGGELVSVEGFGEGLVLGLVLFATYLLTRNKPMRSGRYAAIFLLGYAIIRGSVESVRQWDRQFVNEGGSVLLGMTMGQTLSVGMVIGAILILVWKRAPEPPSDQTLPPQAKP